MTNIKKIIIISFSVVVIAVVFSSKYSAILNSFQSSAQEKENIINEYIQLSESFITDMTLFGNEYLQSGHSVDAALIRYLTYDPETDRYDLNALTGTSLAADSGNLTGVGNIPANGTAHNELNLALQYNKYFCKFYDRLPDIAWIYYTSENNFINIYPWVPSADFAYSPDLKKEVFYSKLTTANNPQRKSLWTPVYMDHAGKGRMLTLSSPIYEQDTFRGVVSVDFTTAMISQMIESRYWSVLADREGSVIATDLHGGSVNDIISLETLMKLSPTKSVQIQQAKTNVTMRIGGLYLYSAGFSDTNWKVYFFIPVWKVAGTSALYALPVVLICLLLLLTFNEVANRKKTELMLKNSLMELQAYHEKLENAATYDFLTNTCNRRKFKECFNMNIAVSGKDIPISLILGDIDYFKKLNDTFGHAGGDKVLVEISRLLKKGTRADDIVCRWGGEEFLIMLFGQSYDEAVLVAERIRREIEELAIPLENGSVISTSMTFGVTEFDFDLSYEHNISCADSALYTGKACGRNQVKGYRSLTSAHINTATVN